MKTNLFGKVATGLAIALMSGGLAFAQPSDSGNSGEDKPKRERKERGEKGEHKGKKQKGPRILFKDIDLSDDQKQQIKTIMQGHREEVEAWFSANKDKIDAIRAKMRQAREDEDKDAAKAAHEEMKALMEGRPKFTAIVDDLANVLDNAEDKAQFRKNVEELMTKLKERREKMKDRRKGDGERKGKGGDREGGASEGGLDI